MSLLSGVLKNLWKPSSIMSNVSSQQQQHQQIRHKWTDWRMLKDYKKRQMMIKYNGERQRINTIRKNDILPRELKEIADREIVCMPPDSNWLRVCTRCSITSRPKGIVHRWKVSRIAFRHLADYNKLAGVQRGLW